MTRHILGPACVSVLFLLDCSNDLPLGNNFKNRQTRIKKFFLIKIKTSFDHKVKGPGKWSLSHHQRGASSVADKIRDLGYFYSQHRVKKHSLPRQCLSILYTVRKSEPKQITAFSINPQIKAHFLAMAPQ